MHAHRYSVGQSVRMRHQYGAYRTEGEVYQILATLPEKDNSPQYRIRSDVEKHERVVTEDGLEGVDPATT
jgi:hypothetical protein